MLLLLACADQTVSFDSGEPAASDEVQGGAEADALFDVSALHELVVELDPDDWAELRAQERTYYDLMGEACMDGPWPSPYTYFPGEAWLDGEAMGEVGVRKKGLIGSVVSDRPSLKIDVGEYVDDQRFFGLEKLVFNNGRQDPSRMRTCLAHQWFSEAGLVAPRCALAHVVVNGEDLGIYAHTENIDEELVVRRSGEWPTAMYEGTLSDFREGWTQTFEYETDDTTGAELEAVTEALEASDSALLDALDAVIDLDAFFTFWAAESIAGHWDGYNANTNNFYAYALPGDGRLRFIASGPDAAFDQREPFWGNDGANAWVGTLSALAHRLFLHDEGRGLYEAELSRQLDAAWDGTEKVAQIDAWAELVAEHDGKSMRTGIEATRTIVELRADDVRDGMARGAEAADLRGEVCWETVGEAQVSFSTTWGSYPNGDVWTAGEADTYYLFDGVEYPSTQDGVSAGIIDDGRAIWLTVSEIAPGVYVAPYAVFDKSLLVDGASLSLDGHDAEGVIMYLDSNTSDQWQTVAYLGNGTLSFSEAGATRGDTLAGVLDVEILGTR
ncbi:MAG: CotH kinase family protein [Deltaproteobacteria bacterium]|nr:CotH kinase family protein [Deltaproteobacteria bacterium]